MRHVGHVDTIIISNIGGYVAEASGAGLVLRE